MLKLLKNLGVAAGLMVLSASGYAAVIEYSSGFAANNLSNYDATSGSHLSDSSSETTNINLARFDASLGTLTDVEITFSSSWDHTSSARAYDNYSEYSTYTRSYRCGFLGWRTCYTTYRDYRNDTAVSLSSNASFTVSLDDPFEQSMMSFDSNYDGCSRYRSNGGYTSCADSTYDNNNDFNGSLDLSIFSLDDFIGSDALDLSFTTDASFNGNCDNNDQGDHCYAYNDAFWSGMVSVIYTYDEITVPEPATLGMFALGLVGLGLSRKRQRS